mgnify:CR=1 FL=1
MKQTHHPLLSLDSMILFADPHASGFLDKCDSSLVFHLGEGNENRPGPKLLSIIAVKTCDFELLIKKPLFVVRLLALEWNNRMDEGTVTVSTTSEYGCEDNEGTSVGSPTFFFLRPIASHKY